MIIALLKLLTNTDLDAIIKQRGGITMYKSFDLEFSVGGLTCRLVNMLAFFTPSGGETVYYEHNHSGIEMHYIAKGTCTFICGKKLINLNAGDILIIPPMQYHRNISDSDDTDKPIAEIADILGYSTAAAFSKFLKSATGKTPSAIRQEVAKL